MPIRPVAPPVAPAIAGPRAPVAAALAPPTPSVAPSVVPGEIVGNERVGFIVAGVNYPRVGHGSNAMPTKDGTYIRAARRYKDHQLAQGELDRVVILDFFTGEVRQFRKGTTGNGDLIKPFCDKLVLDNYRHDDGKTYKADVKGSPKKLLYYTGMHELASSAKADVDKATYDAARGKRFAKERSLSVAHLYELVFQAMDNTVREVHFMGHAYREGPIIVNTPGDNKKAYDKDARSGDFTNPELDSIFGPAIGLFQASFTRDAHLTVWGCLMDDAVYPIVDTAQKKLAKKESIDDELRKLRAILAASYPAKLAKAANKAVLAAPPGTYAVHEGEPNDDSTPFQFKPQVMHVNLEKFSGRLRFYQEHVKLRFAAAGVYEGPGKVGRGYAVFEP